MFRVTPSGTKVWRRWARWFDVTTAVLNLGAARVEAAGPASLTMTAGDEIQLERAMPDATIVALHFEGWGHFSESREQIEEAFQAAGLQARLLWR